jgi:DNA-binding transcriptional MerR regulator
MSSTPDTWNEPRYAIGAVAAMLALHPQTLRRYEELGLLVPARKAGRRLYSPREVELLRSISRLSSQLGLNMAGVEVILRLNQRINELQSEVDILQGARTSLEEQIATLKEELRQAQVHSSLRSSIPTIEQPKAAPRATLSSGGSPRPLFKTGASTMMQERDLQELAELKSATAPILSLYLNADPHRRSSEEHKLSLRRLLSQAANQGAAQADVERIERFFEHEYNRQGRGVACFSQQKLGFWREYELLVPVEDFVFLGQRPYIFPLSDIWDNYGRFGVLMVDREGARAFIYHLGALEDSAGTLGEEVKRHKQGGWAAQKLQRYEDQAAAHNLKGAAAWADDFLRERNVERVVLSGSDGNLALFRDLAPRALQDKVIGQINLDMNTTPVEVWEHAFLVAQAAQRRAESDLLQQVVTAARKGGAGATGLTDTLAAMQANRIHQLLVDRNLHAAGNQCANCGALVVDPLKTCPYCNGKLAATADVVNLVLSRATETGVKVAVLEPSSQLTEVGGIAAVLRY